MPVDREAAARAIDAFLRAIGRDPTAEPDLVGTGGRVADAYIDELCEGYGEDPEALLGRQTIATGPSSSKEVVIVRDITVTTTCPHHLMPAQGTAHVAFAPTSRIVGVGAVVRLVDLFAHRLTLQEVIGREVVGALRRALDPEWAACRIVLSHACMTARGERRHGASVETIAIAGDGDVSAVYPALGIEAHR